MMKKQKEKRDGLFMKAMLSVIPKVQSGSLMRIITGTYAL